MRTIGGILVLVAALLMNSGLVWAKAEVNEPSLALLFEQAQTAQDAGCYTEAISLYERLLERHPGHVDARFKYGLVLAWTKQYDEALQQFEQILQVSPSYWDVKLAQARIHFWQGDSATALSLCREVLTQEADYIEAGLLEAQILADSDPDAAVDRLQEILHQHPDQMEVRWQLARLYDGQGQWSRALDQVERLLQQVPNHVQARKLKEGIERQRQPRWTTAYQTSQFRGYDPLTLLYNAPRKSYSLRQRVDMTWSPMTSMALDLGHRREWERLGGALAYGLQTDGVGVAIRQDIGSSWTLSGKLSHEIFRNRPGTLYTLEHPKSQLTGFAAIQWKLQAVTWEVTGSRESLFPLIRGSLYQIGTLDRIGISGRLQMGPNCWGQVGWYERDYDHLYERYETLGQAHVVLPGYPALEGHILYRNMSAPSDHIINLGVTYQSYWDSWRWRIGPAYERDTYLDNHVALLNGSVQYQWAAYGTVEVAVDYQYDGTEDFDRLLEFEVALGYRF